MLIGKAGPLAGDAYTVVGRVLIGRDSDCDIQIIDRGVSRKHASVLEQQDGTLVLRDLDSHNGTYVGGVRVTETLLVPGDEILVGESRFVFELTDAAALESTGLSDLKLVSGPAAASTLSLELSQEQKDEIADVLAERRQLSAAHTIAPAAPPTALLCCGSPLAAHAHDQGWNFCPACGGALSE